ncbi:MAG: sugar transferase [Gemmataceae bacterium]
MSTLSPPVENWAQSQEPENQISLNPDGRMPGLVRPTFYARVKFLLEWVVAFVLFVVCLPLMLITMLLVKLTSRGPAIYSQTRVGLNGTPFTIYKFRTMWTNCERFSGAKWSTPGDSRITPIGQLLRKSHLDELPQLWNVLRGEMGLVGPRPERPEFVPQLAKAIPLYQNRLLLRPGVTGFAQVQLPPDTSLDSVRIKLAYDLHYLRNLSCWLDIRVVLATAGKLFFLPFSLMGKMLGFAQRETIAREYADLLAVEVDGESVAMPSQ